MADKLFTPAQMRIVSEIVQAHGLHPDQISFEGTEETPFFDYEAVCLLSLKLTDIQNIDCWISKRDSDGPELNFASGETLLASPRSTAKCTIILPDGRSRSCEDSAQIGEKLGNGVEIGSMRLADATAKNRAVRLGIRSVGVNLYHAHKEFMRTGQPTEGHLRYDPQQPIYNEIHAIAAEVDLIVDGDRTAYEHLLEEMFKVDSSKKLNDLERHTFLIALRGMRNVKINMSRQRAATAA